FGGGNLHMFNNFNQRGDEYNECYCWNGHYEKAIRMLNGPLFSVSEYEILEIHNKINF
ncbi:8954_t:CDS:1, partial [Scutellospora calospora]